MNESSMNRKLFGIAALLIAAVALLNLLSCARSQQLVGITLQPSGGFVFEGYKAAGQFTAEGTYIHPPETKDVTDQVVWSLDIANFGTITQQGLVTYTRTDGCGSGQVTATYTASDGNFIVGTAPVSGANNTNAICQ
jgi:hypothetical protein